MMTTEGKSVRWLKYAAGWLNQFEKSALSDPAMLLFDRLKLECDRKETKKAWNIIEDLKRLGNTSDGLEPAEILLMCGLFVAEMGNFKEAQKFFSEASTKYNNSHHHHAVTQWMKGCMDWLLPGKEVDAIAAWREAEKKFQNIRKNENNKDRLAWYNARCVEMHNALHQAAEKYQVPMLPPEALEHEAAFVDANANNRQGSESLRFDRMGLFPVYESINAGSFGPTGILETSVGMLEVQQVFIDDKPFRVVTTNGSSFFRTSTQGAAIIKVSGDSMNNADIQNGDYVLLHILPGNLRDFADAEEQDDEVYPSGYRDGDIVAAEILSEEGNSITLKRFLRRGRKIVLQPDSTNPEHVEREFTAGDAGLTIRGVVQAIFKPV